MDQSVEVSPAPGSVVAEWRGTEPLGLTLGRDLTIEEMEASVGKEKGLAVGLALQAVGDKNVVGFALDGVMAMIDKAKKPGQVLSLRFSPPSQQSVSDGSDLSPLPKAGVSLPAGVDKSKIDFAALIKTGSAPVAVEINQRDTFVRMADSGAPVTATFHQPGPLGIHFSDGLPLRVIKARPPDRSMLCITPPVFLSLSVPFRAPASYLRLSAIFFTRADWGAFCRSRDAALSWYGAAGGRRKQHQWPFTRPNTRQNSSGAAPACTDL